MTSGGGGVRELITRTPFALALGVLSALALWGLDVLAELLRHLLWEIAPSALGVGDGSPWWTVAILTATGLAVGAVVRLAPGHGGPDSATVELDAPVQPVSAVPGIALVTLLALAGGVSLGPESPIIGINVAIAVSLVARLAGWFGVETAVLVTTSGTIGAMFGTPVAAALALTGVVAAASLRGALWDRMFLPLAGAAAGAATTMVLGRPTLALEAGTYTFAPVDLLWAAGVAVAGAAAGGLGALLLPWVHRAFHALRHPVLVSGAGGLVLGLLGALGGPLTLFRGLDETAELVADPLALGAGALAALAGVKLAALLVAAGSGFRGGRVFPAVFVGAALGLIPHALWPESVPLGLAVGAAVLGMVLAVLREGWLAIFIGVAISGDFGTLPVLVVAVLPAWLLVTSAPAFLVRPPAATRDPDADAPQRDQAAD